LLESWIPVVFVLVNAKLYVPLPLTSGVTSSVIQVPDAKVPEDDVTAGA
jgi:hypothetical protein